MKRVNNKTFTRTYVIINKSDEEKHGFLRYLSSFILQHSTFPSKTWDKNIENAIKFDSVEDADRIVQLLKVNTPDKMDVKIIDEDYAPFDKRDRKNIEDGKKEIFFKSAKRFYPARIICWDREGIKNNEGDTLSIVALVQHPSEGELIFETTENGEAWSSQQGIHQALYVKYSI